MIHAEVGSELVANHVGGPILADTLGDPLVESLRRGDRTEKHT